MLIWLHLDKPKLFCPPNHLVLKNDIHGIKGRCKKNMWACKIVIPFVFLLLFKFSNWLIATNIHHQRECLIGGLTAAGFLLLFFATVIYTSIRHKMRTEVRKIVLK